MTMRLFGLLGWPVGHSVSPAMMNAAFAAVGVDAVYVPFAVPPERFQAAVDGLLALQAVGVNVTIPHKQRAFQMAVDRTPEAALAKAVNTLRFDSNDGVISGHNTDVGGWWASVRAYAESGPARVTLLGGGGAARAVVAALALHRPQVQLAITARHQERVKPLMADFEHDIHITFVPWEKRHDAIADSDWVVNSTPVGMHPNVDASPVDDAGCFQAGQLVQDLIYRPSPTRLLKMAADKGCTVQDGLAMLVGQGAEAFRWWSGLEPPVETMHRAALQALTIGVERINTVQTNSRRPVMPEKDE
ncbi:shikimate dehydrogenase [Alicyclobacillus pomorum]